MFVITISIIMMLNIIIVGVDVVVDVVAVIGVRVVEVGATCGSPGHHGIVARRRAWVDPLSSALWVHDPPVGY